MISVIIALYIPLSVCIANTFRNLDFWGELKFSSLRIEKFCVNVIEKSHNLHIFLHYYSWLSFLKCDIIKKKIRFLIVKTNYTELSNSFICASNSLIKCKMLRADFCSPPPFAFTPRCMLEELVVKPRISKFKRGTWSVPYPQLWNLGNKIVNFWGHTTSLPAGWLNKNLFKYLL